MAPEVNANQINDIKIELVIGGSWYLLIKSVLTEHVKENSSTKNVLTVKNESTLFIYSGNVLYHGINYIIILEITNQNATEQI